MVKAKRECSGRPMRKVCPPPYMEFVDHVVPGAISQSTHMDGVVIEVLTHCMGSKILPSSQLLVKRPFALDDSFAEGVFKAAKLPREGVDASGKGTPDVSAVELFDASGQYPGFPEYGLPPVAGAGG